MAGLLREEKISMARKRVLSRGMNIERSHGSIDSRMIDASRKEIVESDKRLHELGEKFERDKEKLEAQIDKIMNSKISQGDKRSLLQELRKGVEQLQEQYDNEVAQEKEKLQENLKETIGEIEEGIGELEAEEDDMRNIETEASDTDASAGAEAAAMTRQKFENLKSEADSNLEEMLEKLQSQNERMHRSR